MNVLADIPHAIQLALAPVFLLSGIAGMLNVVAGRLARIVDRGRHLTENPVTQALLPRAALQAEFLSLERRRHLASRAIASCTFSALLVCVVIGGLFVEALLDVELKWLFGVLFTCSMVALVSGLAYFLAEVRLANRTVRIRHSDLDTRTTDPGQSPGAPEVDAPQ